MPTLFNLSDKDLTEKQLLSAKDNGFTDVRNYAVPNPMNPMKAFVLATSVAANMKDGDAAIIDSDNRVWAATAAVIFGNCGDVYMTKFRKKDQEVYWSQQHRGRKIG